MLSELQKLAIWSHTDKRTVEKQADALVQVLLGISLKDIENDSELREYLSEKVEWSNEK